MVDARVWVPVVDGPRPKRPRLTMVMVLVPSSLMRFCTACEDPVPTATRMITAPTPMRMPEDGQRRAQLVGGQPPQGGADVVGPGHDADPSDGRGRTRPGSRSSERMRPSRTRTTRSA